MNMNMNILWLVKRIITIDWLVSLGIYFLCLQVWWRLSPICSSKLQLLASFGLKQPSSSLRTNLTTVRQYLTWIYKPYSRPWTLKRFQWCSLTQIKTTRERYLKVSVKIIYYSESWLQCNDGHSWLVLNANWCHWNFLQSCYRISLGVTSSYRLPEECYMRGWCNLSV